jgi:glycosyltransferase involved in cell wall biosynthesis
LRYYYYIERQDTFRVISNEKGLSHVISNKRLKIIHLRWAECIGGVENMLLNLAIYSDHNQVETSFLFLKRGGPYEQELKSMGYSVDVIQAWRGYDPIMRWKLALKLRQLQPDIVVEHGVPPFVRPLIKIVTGVPLLSFDHGQIEINRRKYKPWINELNGIEYRLFCDQIISNSAANARQIIEQQRISPSRVRVVHLGIDLAHFRFFATRSAEDQTSELILGYVGRLQNYDKGTDYLPHLAKQLTLRGFTNFKLYIVGSGPDENAIRKLAQELGVYEWLVFIGQKNDITEWVRGMDILIVPSRTEAFGLVAVEALAVGTRVIAFAVGGLAEILTDCTAARLVAPNDIIGMADAILDLWKNFGKEKSLEARRYVETRFDARRMVEDMMEIYREVGCQTSRLSI